MPIRRILYLGAGAVLSVLSTTPVQAQPLGSFTWQLQPFCNKVTASVTQNVSVYTIDGYDDQCGAAQRAPLVGLATQNPDGSIGLACTSSPFPAVAPCRSMRASTSTP